ncbi:Amidohydrolase [compost metagenome]
MRIIDFNIHPPLEPNSEQERDTSSYDVSLSLSRIAASMKDCFIDGGNLMVLDVDFLQKEPKSLLSQLKGMGLRCTVMIDPRRDDAFDMVDRAAELGIAGLKYHPYMLNLAPHDHLRAIAVARHAATRGMCIAVDCSYGTLRVFDVNGVRLVAALLQVLQTPVVALHGGGRLVLEVMSLAMEAPHLYIDTSFSVSFWAGSSVEQDFAFAMKKLGCHRWLFGSDHPYVPMGEAVRDTLAFLDRGGFGATEIERVMAGTAEELFSR